MKVEHLHSQDVNHSQTYALSSHTVDRVADNTCLRKESSLVSSFVETDMGWWEQHDGNNHFVNKGLSLWEERRREWREPDAMSHTRSVPRERSLALLIAICFQRDEENNEYETDDKDGFFP